MKALIIERNGEPSEVVHWRDSPEPTPGPDEVRVRMLLAPVHPSVLHVRGARADERDQQRLRSALRFDVGGRVRSCASRTHAHGGRARPPGRCK
ncbi:hypothetical protein AWB75_03690 [Caballeronia catudaia]|uniref:Alcohol dehydrogenase n=1 Tax=Caballeronia catudaia TaxID=1777136 RepID=A0A158BM95_9BURK|nr:hypothetical protein AWB75_03690 [Caballeronia catudaia]